jgi:protease IV
MRQFIKQALASTIGSLLGLTLFSAVSLTFFLIIIGAIVDSAGQKTSVNVRDKSVLVFDLSRTVVDLDPGETLQQAIAGEKESNYELKTIVDAIDAAAKDKRILAIYLDGSSSGSSSSGLGTLREVRNALERFRATGKQIIAYEVDLNKRDYYLVSTAKTALINPMGSLDINGFRSEMMFYKGAFDRYGIGVEVVRVGKYKSFGETWSMNKFSPEARQETQELLDNLWSDFKSTVGKNRQIAPEKIQQAADERGILTAQQAIKAGLFDRTAYQDEVVETLKKITGTDRDKKHDFRQISLDRYAEDVSENARTADRKIAVVYAQGNIVSGEGTGSQIGGDKLARQLRELRQDEDVKAIVLRVNSPGGSAVASDIIQREVKLTQKVKPVIVSMGDVAASGGYWISTYADKIFAEPNTITGSIGVIGINFNYQKLANSNGITWDTIKTSKLADSITIARPRTPAELAISQQMVDDIYEDFITKVSESRKLPKEKVNEIAQGRVWAGTDAKRVGLIDELGGLNDAIAYAAKKSKLGDDWELDEYPAVETWEDKLLEKLTSQQSEVKLNPTNDPLSREIIKVKKELAALQSLNDPRGVYVRMPYTFQPD